MTTPIRRFAGTAALACCVLAAAQSPEEFQEAYEASLLERNLAIAGILLDSPVTLVHQTAGATPRARVVVFTDPTCPYSRRLHGDLEEITAAGIEVQYALYSRSAPPKPRRSDMSWLMDFWCVAPDEREASADTLFRELQVPRRGADCDQEVAEALSRTPIEIAHSIGVTGTPTFLTDSGRMHAGYRDAEDLIAEILRQ